MNVQNRPNRLLGTGSGRFIALLPESGVPDEKPNNRTAVGIDLGASKCVVAIRGQTQPVNSECAGEPNEPRSAWRVSCVLPTVELQDMAVNATVRDWMKARSLVRVMGRRFEDLTASEKRGPFECRAESNDRILVTGGEKPYPPVDVIAGLLRAIKGRVRKELGTADMDLALTISALSTHPQRKQYLTAAKKAGFQTCHLLPTTVAALTAEPPEEGETVVLCDLGAGSFEVVVVAVEGDSIHVITHRDDPQLGGDDWDAAIAEEFASSFATKTGIDLRRDAGCWGRTLIAARCCKEKLSLSEEATVRVQRMVNQFTWVTERTLTVSQEDLVDLALVDYVAQLAKETDGTAIANDGYIIQELAKVARRIRGELRSRAQACFRYNPVSYGASGSRGVEFCITRDDVARAHDTATATRRSNGTPTDVSACGTGQDGVALLLTVLMAWRFDLRQGVDLQKCAKARAELRISAMQAREQLRTRKSVVVDLHTAVRAMERRRDPRFRLTRVKLLNLSKELRRRIGQQCVQALVDAKANNRSINRVLLLGAGMKVSGVVPLVRRLFSDATVDRIEDEHAPVIGACMHAARAAETVPMIAVNDIYGPPLRLCNGDLGELTVAPPNTDFTLAHHIDLSPPTGTAELVIDVIQGPVRQRNPPRPVLRVTIPPTREGNYTHEFTRVVFRVDANGLLYVRATEHPPGAPAARVVCEPLPSLSEAATMNLRRYPHPTRNTPATRDLPVPYPNLGGLPYRVSGLAGCTIPDHTIDWPEVSQTLDYVQNVVDVVSFPSTVIDAVEFLDEVMRPLLTVLQAL